MGARLLPRGRRGHRHHQHFTATAIAQADYGLEEPRCRIARRAADAFGPDRFVAGSVGPTNQTLSLSPRVNEPAYRTVSFDRMAEAYAEQIRGLVEGGIDVLLIETIFDTLNAKAAIAAASDVAPDVPLMISVTITDRSGRTLSGQTVDAFWLSIPTRTVTVVVKARSARPRCAVPRVVRASRPLHDCTRTPAAERVRRTTTPRDELQYLREFDESGLANVLGAAAGPPTNLRRARRGCGSRPKVRRQGA